MRIRSIRPEFYDSESMGDVSWDARFVFECLWSYVQDNGVNRDNARMIRGTCMPYDSDEVIPRIEAALDELEAVGCIVRYTWRGKRLLWLPGFLVYQKIDRPSMCLFPTPDDLETNEDSTDTRDTLATHSRHTRDRSRSRSKSKDIVSRGGGGSKSTLTRARAREAATPTATEGEREPDEANVLDAWSPSEADLAAASGLGVDGDAVAHKLRDKLTRKGFDACGVNRHTAAALDATFRSWVEHEAQWAGERPKPVKPPPVAKTPKRKATPWNDPKVLRLLEPYKSRFPPREPGDLGPSRDWYVACKSVAKTLDKGVDVSVVERVFSAADSIHDAKSVKTALETINTGTP